ncbi:hypothetical protein [Methylobacterium aquaticum]|uniref:Uncharacterized protein n=1 Tax=Methylobacterium aquaticum TaxID=270351 RepID=A0A0C6FCG1_9HYPH|nr:hypothetical protein [Methylobacterium aquaticum]BAQ50386.1 hypothetical protein Maq22A_4p60150 [Methylobacterium aquaticum]
MTYAEMKEAIARAHPSTLEDLRAKLAAACAAGSIGWEIGNDLDDAIEARMKARRPEAPAPAGFSLGAAIATTARAVHRFERQRRQASPDKARSRERRRGLGGSSAMSEPMSRRYTEGQRAVLFIVGQEIAQRGVCALSIGEIAARAGVCHRHAQTTLRLAEGDGLITITERPRKGQKHQTNLVRVLSKEWAVWLARWRPTGCRPLPATGIQDSLSSSESKKASRGNVERGFRRGDSGSGPAGRGAGRLRI